jgi:hypothetical protein
MELPSAIPLPGSELPLGSRVVINTCIPLRFMLGDSSRNFVRTKLRPPDYAQLIAKGN